ncbi:MAG: dihydrofolate reductase [Lachnospiraceae bacterium]
MNLIVAVTKNWGIGKDNDLLVSIPEDMKFFRTTTSGKTVIMGRKTLESFPGGRPLKNRTNIVITTNPDYEKEGAVIVPSVEEAVKAVADVPEEDVFVIGGASIYTQMLPYINTAFVTRIDVCPEADTFFPDLEADPEWELAEQSEEKEYEGITFRFCTYKRRSTN